MTCRFASTFFGPLGLASKKSSRLLGFALLLPTLFTAGCFNSDQPSAAALNGPGKAVIRLEKVEWGRLVDIADVNGVLVQEDVLIRQSLVPDGINYEIQTNPVTEEQTLFILQQTGTAQFDVLLTTAQSNLDEVDTKGPLSAPPYPLIGRNGAIRLCFSEQVRPSTVNADTIKVVVGDPPILPFTVRYIVQNDKKAGKGKIILDPTISSRQSATLGLPQNAVGFPPSLDSIADNIKIRIPTEVNTTLGQPQVLTNLSGTRNITAGPTDPMETDFGSIPVIVRSLRSGNDADPSQGFLRDEERPNLITSQDVTVTSVTVGSGGKGTTREFVYRIDDTLCDSLVPKVGDVFEIVDKVLTVNAVLDFTPGAFEVQATLVEEDPIGGVNFDQGATNISGRITTRYTPQDSEWQICYLNFLPTAVETGTNPINIEVAPDTTTISIRFDEPIDSRSVLSTHSMVLIAYEASAGSSDPTAYYQQYEPETVGVYIDRQQGFNYNPNTPTASEYGGRVLFGPVEVSNGNKAFTLRPLAGFTDPDNGGQQFYAIALRDGPDGILDLAGNSVNFVSFVPGTPGLTGAVDKLITHVSTPTTDKYLSLRGNAIDENGDGLPEYGGQYDVLQGKITGRPAERFSLQADSSNQYIGALPPITTGSPFGVPPKEPLTPAGAVVQTNYRPQDLGFGFLNPLEYNMNIEGMSWSPLGGVVLDDNFSRFTLGLAHSNVIPDEAITPTGQPAWPFSGLATSNEFDQNILGFPDFDETVVFDKSYQLRAVNLFQAASGVTMLPWPSFDQEYTFRDTAIPQNYVGTLPTPSSIGSPPSTYTFAGFWAGGQVPSVGLALLATLGCFPRGNFIGINTFQVTKMLPSSALPAFTVFSYGGQDSADVWHQVIPGNDQFGGTRPVGGFLNGQPTQLSNSYVYWAQLDFVVRVSRVYTHWFDLGTGLTTGDILGVLLEPDNANQANGTEVQIDYRGSVSVTNSTNPNIDPSPLTDAEVPFDDYGDFVDTGVGSSVGTPSAWSSDPLDLEKGTQPFFYVQFRFSFVSNATQGVRSVLDGFGIAYDF